LPNAGIFSGIFFVIFVPIGFLLYAIAYGSEAESFKSWITHPARNYLLGWVTYGAVMGALWHFISEAAKNSN
jgi:hypothetical protein